MTEIPEPAPSVINLSLLCSPGYLTGLSLLLINDFLFKPLFHNTLTGKLSDLSGLFIFPIFFTTLLPRQKKSVYWLTGLLFILWKTEYSQPLINAWNHSIPFHIARAVDYTDLFALAVLPLSYKYLTSKNDTVSATKKFFMLSASLFAFSATSPAPITYDYEKDYVINSPKDTVFERIKQFGGLEKATTGIVGDPETGKHLIIYNAENCSQPFHHEATALVRFTEIHAATNIHLASVNYDFRCKDIGKDATLKAFEQGVIAKLK